MTSSVEEEGYKSRIFRSPPDLSGDPAMQKFHKGRLSSSRLSLDPQKPVLERGSSVVPLLVLFGLQKPATRIGVGIVDGLPARIDLVEPQRLEKCASGIDWL